MKMLNQKYLIALDLDGTLLNDKKEISFLTKKYLQRLNKSGVNIVLCSGRAPRTMMKYYKELKLNSPMISYNGALTFNPKDSNFNKIEYKFDHNKLKDVYSVLNDYVELTMCETKDTIYTDKEDEFLFTFFQRNNMNVIDNIDTLNEDTFTYVIKLKEENDNIEARNKIQNLVAQHTKNYNLRYWHTSNYGEFSINNINKAEAVKNLAKQLNIDEKNVFVFGDAGNDLELLSSFENSFLMKNGIDELKDKVNNITQKDNNHNGIYYELKPRLKKNKKFSRENF